MRDVDPALQGALDSGATTLCRCWRIDRRDGVALGFTDHDEALAFDGLRFEAAAGLGGSSVERATGLAGGDAAVMGALSSDAISAEDVALGRYDGAAATLWLVDWRDPARRHLLFRGTIGRIERGARAFTAEVEGLAAPLERLSGRALLPRCDARFGDARCGIAAAAHSFACAVTAVDARGALVASGLEGAPAGWCDGGALRWTRGLNAGLSATVRRHEMGPERATLALWAAPGAAVAPGDEFVVTAGCDKRFETCRTKFGNALNFRGFPHVPGDDWVAAYPVSGERNDGGSRQG
jgi:uncharacterized phage protein (TIGR02218 family)